LLRALNSLNFVLLMLQEEAIFASSHSTGLPKLDPAAKLEFMVETNCSRPPQYRPAGSSPEWSRELVLPRAFF
jgi:hypothetical protein